MAILSIWIEDEKSLPLNEFFDMNGKCYASCNRHAKPGEDVINLYDFYDADVSTDLVTDATVVFLMRDSKNESIIRLYGWYKDALVYAREKVISLYMTGNVVADTSNAVFLEQPVSISLSDNSFHFRHKIQSLIKKDYEVIEKEDVRYDLLMKAMSSNRNKNVVLRYGYVFSNIKPEVKKNYKLCAEAAAELARRVMDNEIKDIRDLKALYDYALLMSSLKRNDCDSLYYIAFAEYHLGFFKKAIKSIKKLISLEGETADVLAMEALILVGLGYYDSAIEAFEKANAYEESDEYLELIERIRDF